MVFNTSLRFQVRALFVLLSILGFSVLSVKAETIPLTPEIQSLNIGVFSDYVEDKKGEMTLKDLMSQSGSKLWINNQKKALSFGYTKSVYWVRANFVNPGDKDLSYLVEVAYPVIDHISVHILREGNEEIIEFGDKFPFFKRPIEHRNFLFPLTIASKERITMILRVQTTSSMQIPLFIHNERYFMQKDQTVMIGLGLYYGAMVIMLLYNLFVYLSVREINYLYYVLYVASTTFFITSINGTSYHYLWPDSTWWNDQVLVVSLNGVVVFAVLFTMGFLKIKESRPKSYWVFVFFGVVSAGIILFAYKIPYKIGILSGIALVILSFIWCMIVTVLRWMDGYSAARFYVLAWFPMLLGGVALALNKIALIPRNILTENAIQYGSVLEVMLLSFALADRLNSEKKERIEAQDLAHLQERNARIANENALINERKAREAREHAFEVQRKAKETLEQKVEERTHELNETLDVVKEANSQILSSLRYARMIQLAMLPQSERISEYFSRHFVWWQPRDIVGGDFYYIDAIEPGYIVAVADCTGHGVPGAFMTLIASSELKRIVRGEACYDPGEILTRLNRRIRKTLKQNTATAISDDGLDIGICVVRKKELIIEFAGARMDLIYTEDDSIHTVHGNKNSVGYVSSKTDYVYSRQHIPYLKNMTFYMFSDGITDQIGQESSIRFGKKQLMETIYTNRHLNMELQYKQLKKTLDNYRGERDQMDDMTMIAFGDNG